MRKIAVVILNWNGQEFLRKFLPSVVKFSIDDAEIIVADNASTDDSIKVLETEFPQVRIIKNETNSGFSSGYNNALKHVKAKYYVLINSDLEVTKNWINPVIDLMESDENIAVCQPKIKSYHEKEMFEYAGAAGGFLDKYGYPFCRGRIFQSMEKDEGQYNDVCEIFWASGSSFFVKAELFNKYGGFDGDFFAHMEEIDLCWRLKNEGFKIMYCPDSTVFHVGGGTLPKSLSKKTYLNFRNNFILMYKNLPYGRVIRTIIARLILDAVAGMKFLSQGDYKDSLAVMRAHIFFYRRLRTTRAKRKLISHRQVSCLYNSNIVFEHFMWKKKYFSQLDANKFSK